MQSGEFSKTQTSNYTFKDLKTKITMKLRLLKEEVRLRREKTL